MAQQYIPCCAVWLSPSRSSKKRSKAQISTFHRGRRQPSNQPPLRAHFPGLPSLLRHSTPSSPPETSDSKATNRKTPSSLRSHAQNTPLKILVDFPSQQIQPTGPSNTELPLKYKRFSHHKAKTTQTMRVKQVIGSRKTAEPLSQLQRRSTERKKKKKKGEGGWEAGNETDDINACCRGNRRNGNNDMFRAVLKA